MNQIMIPSSGACILVKEGRQYPMDKLIKNIVLWKVICVYGKKEKRKRHEEERKGRHEERLERSKWETNGLQF